jgi:hypothetical protein
MSRRPAPRTGSTRSGATPPTQRTTTRPPEAGRTGIAGRPRSSPGPVPRSRSASRRGRGGGMVDRWGGGDAGIVMARQCRVTRPTAPTRRAAPDVGRLPGRPMQDCWPVPAFSRRRPLTAGKRSRPNRPPTAPLRGVQLLHLHHPPAGARGRLARMIRWRASAPWSSPTRVSSSTRSGRRAPADWPATPPASAPSGPHERSVYTDWKAVMRLGRGHGYGHELQATGDARDPC